MHEETQVLLQEAVCWMSNVTQEGGDDSLQLEELFFVVLQRKLRIDIFLAFTQFVFFLEYQLRHAIFSPLYQVVLHKESE